jgi:hypothetical protein
MTTSFVPRPIYRVHTLGVVVEKGDTATGIAQKLGRPAGDYRELVAANLHGRTLMPMALGSPYAARTFAKLTEGEVLRVPAHWPNPGGAEAAGTLGAPGTVGEQMLDPVATAIAQLTQQVSQGSGGVNAPYLSGITNAAVQWWHAAQGTTPAASSADYLPYVTSAVAWVNQFAMPGNAGTPAGVASFPWGAFLAMLPALPDMQQVDWASGTIPGTNGVPWTSIPWSYLSQIGTQLETLKLPPVQWPADTSPQAVYAAILAAIQAAQATPTTGGTAACGQNSAIGAGGQCYCNPGFVWVSDPNSLDCVAASGPAQPGTPGQPATPGPQGQSCPQGSTYDATAPGGAGCYSCPPGQPYDPASHTCSCPAGTMFDANVGKCLAPPKSQADCAVDPGSVFDPNGSAGPHCYACDAGFTYSMTSHLCEPNSGNVAVQKACPTGFTRDANGNCVQNAPPAPKKDDPKNSLAADTTSKTLLYGALGLGVLAVLGGGVYIATRPKAGEPKKPTKPAKKASK